MNPPGKEAVIRVDIAYFMIDEGDVLVTKGRQSMAVNGDPKDPTQGRVHSIVKIAAPTRCYVRTFSRLDC
jgi:hypothetical protein